jgi:mannose-6-phosphate isomerase-like protein (cupin superfamily)
MDGFYGNINDITLSNVYYRRVLSTTPTMQLVTMSLAPNQEIGMEKHEYTTQFIRVESGNGIAIINGIEYELYDNIAVVIPPDTWHNIINTANNHQLKLYTIYSPPEHPRDTLQFIKPV